LIRPGQRVTAAWRSLSVGKLMRVDPRLQRLVDLMERASASQHAGSSAEFGRRFEEFITAAQAISDDRAVPVEIRAVATKILARFDAAVRANVPALLASVAKMARDPNLGAAERAEAADLLARANEHLPAASNQRH
jgi:uncharacterized protein (UPF0147 family)